MKIKLTHLFLMILLAVISCDNSTSSNSKFSNSMDSNGGEVELTNLPITEHKNEAYPSDVVQNFMNACAQNGGKQDYCSCVLDKIQTKYSIEEYIKIEMEMKLRQTTSDFLDFLTSIQIECSALNDFSANTSEVTKHETCNICGEKFSHNGFEEIDFGVWKLARSHIQTWVCSEKCGLQANRNSEETIENVYTEAEKILNPHGKPYPKQDYIMGSDGKIHETKNCYLCSGEGHTVYLDPITGRKGYERCSACDGEGHLSY